MPGSARSRASPTPPCAAEPLEPPAAARGTFTQLSIRAPEVSAFLPSVAMTASPRVRASTASGSVRLAAAVAEIDAALEHGIDELRPGATRRSLDLDQIVASAWPSSLPASASSLLVDAG